MAKADFWKDESDRFGAVWRKCLSFVPSGSELRAAHFERIVRYCLHENGLRNIPNFEYQPYFETVISREYVDHKIDLAFLGESIFDHNWKILWESTTSDADAGLLPPSSSSELREYLVHEDKRPYISRSVKTATLLRSKRTLELLDKSHKSSPFKFSAKQKRTFKKSEEKRNYIENAMAAFSYVLYLEKFRQIATKTWGKTDTLKRLWTDSDYCFLASHYNLVPRNFATPEMTSDDKRRRGSSIDPTEILWESYPLLDLDDPGSFIIVYLVVDFIQELMMFNRFDSHRATLICEECGAFYKPSIYGHGNKYCSRQCKERARAQRRRAKSEQERHAKRYLD